MRAATPSKLNIGRASILAVVVTVGWFSGCAEDPEPLTYDSIPAVADTVLPPIPTITVSGTPIEPIGTAAAGAIDTGPVSSLDPSDPTTPATAAPATALTGPGEVIGTEWEVSTANLAGLSSECGNLSFVSAHPERDQLIAGVALSGLWSSTDGSEEWTQLGQADGSAEITNRTASIVYDPENPDRFWESGTYNGGGGYVTVDGGATFTELGDLVHTDSVTVDFSDPERRTLLATIHEQPTVMRSTDGGETWVDVSAGLPVDVMGVAAASYVVDADTHLVGTRLGEEAGVFRTTDGGETWTRVYVAAISGAPLRAADGRLYWLLDNGEGVIASDDDGETWSVVGIAPFHPFGTSLVDLGEGRIAALGATRILVSVDRGASWIPIGPTYPFEPNGLTYSPFRQAFYLWKFECDEGPNDVPEDAIVRLDFTAS